MAPGNSDHKDDITLYKEIYNRERDRRFVLDNAISQPITISSALAALLYFLYSKTTLAECSLLNYVIIALLVAAFLFFIRCLFFLAKSFNKLIDGFEYEELPTTTDIRKYQEGIKKYNATAEEQDMSFEVYLIDNYVKCADSYIKINDTRSLHLYHAKKAMIIALGITILAIIFFIIKSQL
jgi:hypothetical protein